MKKTITILFMSIFSMAASAASFSDYGNVVSVSPKFKMDYQSVPTEECRDVDVYRTRNEDMGGNNQGGNPIIGNLLGGALGGIIGNQIGGGKGKVAATIGGAILGSTIIGGKINGSSSYGRRDQSVTEHSIERKCKTVYKREGREIFDTNIVVVEYNNHKITFNSERRYVPGDRVPLNIGVSISPRRSFNRRGY